MQASEVTAWCGATFFVAIALTSARLVTAKPDYGIRENLSWNNRERPGANGANARPIAGMGDKRTSS
jgi:hypothetical protein